MLNRCLLALAGLALLMYAAPDAHADIVQLDDGRFLPKQASELTPGQEPDMELLRETRNQKLELSYETVTLRSERISAGKVVKVWSSAATMNSSYNEAYTFAASGNFGDAAQLFAAAAEELEGAAKEIALYESMLALQIQWKSPKAMMTAASNLLKAFPKSYYFAAAHTLRAKVFMQVNKPKQAKEALETIINASNMNARDLYAAKVLHAEWFLLRQAGKDVGKLAAAEKELRVIASEADRRGEQARTAALKAKALAAKALVFQGKFADAQREFEQITNDNTVEDKPLLAVAYNGLGDAVYAQAKDAIRTAGSDEGKKKAIMDQLETAALHYLRVTELYGAEFAPEENVSALQYVARVFASQFMLGGGKDCNLGKRAFNYYVQAWRLLPRGEVKNQLGREAKKFKEDLDLACKPPEPEGDDKDK